MLTATKPRTTQPLSHTDKAAIAAILSWDLCKLFAPEEIEAIRVNGEWVTVRLSQNRAVPIHREVFCSIWQRQQAV